MPGCPFGPSHPGWYILVEAFYTPDPGRTYGQGTYGSDYYGDPNAVGATWVDITHPGFELSIITGGADASVQVPVTEMRWQLQDDTGAWYDQAAPGRYNLPAVGAPIRFGLIAPEDETGRTPYYQLAGGHIEAVVDEHDRPPRFVEMTAYGNLQWLVTSLPGWQRPQETADARLAAIIAAAGGATHSPPASSLQVLADPTVRTVRARDELDRTALSVGLYVSEAPTGVIRFPAWPHVASGAPLIVSDCPVAGEHLAHSITFLSDTGAILNTAIVANEQQPPVTLTSQDSVSVAKYGQRSEALGFPITGLAFVDAWVGQDLADRARARYQDIVNRVEVLEVDSAGDPAWLGLLATIDVGQRIHITRRGVTLYELDTILVGYELRLLPDRIAASLYVTTVTPTL